MEPERQREIASKGGKAAHEKGTAHRWSEQEAKEAGRKGGAASHRNGHRTATRLHVATEDVAAGTADQTERHVTPQAELHPNDQADQNPSDRTEQIASDDFRAHERLAPESTVDDSGPNHSRS